MILCKLNLISHAYVLSNIFISLEWRLYYNADVGWPSFERQKEVSSRVRPCGDLGYVKQSVNSS